MSDDKLTKEQERQLQKALDDIISEAKNVVDDYFSPALNVSSFNPARKSTFVPRIYFAIELR